ncbi:tetratricopeptide repeat protein [Nostoc sp. UIC 10630]|uniref:tetratricopeptide repeat protein n=1 Tax=Nostoc sp. UIC 10630 TaxID=2100146 RepID=UPI001FB08AAA|nr:tetratricopeptide repeat protein [Nostoc sp. UIC 10630]
MSNDKPKRLRFDINHVYNILGLKPGASVDEVKQAYRQMAKTWHPDCFIEPQQKLEAEEKIKEINQAYARLKSYQPDETNQSASTSIKIDFTPSNAESFYKLGMEKAQKGKYTEAIEDFTQAIRLNPNYSADHSVKLWDVNTGQELYTLNNHSDWVNSVAFSPDSKTLASGSRDMTIKLWRCDI